MLIRLDESLQQVQEPVSAAAQEAIDIILRAHRNGSHYVVGRRRTLNHLRTFRFYSGLASTTLDQLYRRTTYDLALYNSEMLGLSVVYNAPQIWGEGRYSLDSSAILPKLRATSLLGENIEDAKFFRTCGELYFVKQKMNSHLNCELVSGGGNTTADVLKERLNDKCLVLCIVDSDKKHPNDSIGDTAKRCHQVSEKNPQFHRLKVTGEVRETENLIPLSLLKLSTSEYHVDLIETQLASPSESLAHLNLKEGLRKFELTHNKDCSDYWKSQFRRNSSAGELMKNACKNSCLSREKCVCVLIQGLGVNLLKEVNSTLSSQGRHRTWKSIKFEWNHVLDKTGRLVAEWCFAPPPSRL